MNRQVKTKERDVVLVEDAAWIRVMGQPVLEALPSARAPTRSSPRSSWSHEAVAPVTPEMASLDTEHSRRPCGAGG